ncbi:MAG: BMP family ABC transporter substrate-binding protein [Clostridiaceae bacterium]|jgi:basic membrane protein A|nr:BMP family ABC transporter substrate-binding protein [Clostridiaceae bacterium]
MKKITIVLLAALVLTFASVFAGCNAMSEFKIGVICDGGKDDTAGYTYAHLQGVLQMQKELGLKDGQIIVEDGVPDGDSAAVSAAAEKLIESGCKMIIGISYGYADTMLEKAKENPKIIFSHCSGGKDNFGAGKANNMNNFFGRIYQARYMAGVAAGFKAKETGNPNIGYVSAFGHKGEGGTAETASGVNAFALGAQAVYPDAVIRVKITGAWGDFLLEAECARTLLDGGCGVITHHGDTVAPALETAATEGKYFIGYNSDIYAAVERSGLDGTAVLTSAVWNWGVYYMKAVKAAMKCFEDGQFISADAWTEFSNYYRGYDKGLFDLTPFSAAASDDTRAAITALKAWFLDDDNDWDVFTSNKLNFIFSDSACVITQSGQILTANDGTPVPVDRDGVIEDDVIALSMNYWLKGVEVVP